MQALLVLGASVIGWLLWSRFGDEYKDGESPFQQLPAGVSPSPAGDQMVNASSGRRYTVSHWVPDSSGQQFHVAELEGKPAWVSYHVNKMTGARKLFAALGTTEDRDAMRKDWSL